MIKAVFNVNASGVCGFSLSGHAGAGECGQDIICAAVSGAVQCVIAVLEEGLGINGCISVVDGEENIITCDILNVPQFEKAVPVLEGFKRTMEEWEKDFPKNISLKIITI